ncbi:hypothetical protein EK21DRAFT_97628 [Setomelanomma holmii]|uniref:Uncharacterized protein n=1 Tax=Setomelanomma holmii TaxID=210430 RepID=A0A9P4HFD3_9PLEO|nr:hypothetical protein EK21DRAFT_97628 [Setomelanomma holmii]
MPTDQHGVTHAGSLGLFDDDIEIKAAADRSERHERDRLATLLRREERRAGRRHRREARSAEREAHRGSTSSWRGSWFGKTFGSRIHEDRGSEKKTLLGERGVDEENEPPPTGCIRISTEYTVVRGPVSPSPVYTAEDIDPVDSPWLRECGMVRVKSEESGGCHIVPKSNIQKND